jgi:hypothetical protein
MIVTRLSKARDLIYNLNALSTARKMTCDHLSWTPIAPAPMTPAINATHGMRKCTTLEPRSTPYPVLILARQNKFSGLFRPQAIVDLHKRPVHHIRRFRRDAQIGQYDSFGA